MDFNTCISEYVKGNVIIEDVIIDHSFDGTNAHVTLCGPYGLELADLTIADVELDSLKDTLQDCNIIND